jgi:hypothetical protein
MALLETLCREDADCDLAALVGDERVAGTR